MDTGDGTVGAHDRRRGAVDETGGGGGCQARRAVVDAAAERRGPECREETDVARRRGGSGMVPRDRSRGVYGAAGGGGRAAGRVATRAGVGSTKRLPRRGMPTLRGAAGAPTRR